MKFKFNLNNDSNESNDKQQEEEEVVDSVSILNQKYSQMLKDIENNNVDKYDKNIKAYNIVKDNELFNSKYYISEYQLPISEEYALLHYLDKGYKEGLNPSLDFNGNKYLMMNPDVKNANFNPLVHYLKFGIKENRKLPLSNHEEIMNEISQLHNDIYVNRILNNLNAIRNKVSSKKKINVVFILPAMMFVYKELYKLFDEDELFNVQIVLVPHRLGRSKTITDVAKDKHYQILSYLKDNHYNVIDGYDFDKNIGINLETECKPDILFYVLPYMRLYPSNMTIDNLPPNILYAYIPYGEFLDNELDDIFYNFGWNEKAWKIFCSTNDYLINSAEKSTVGSSNVVVSGSPRMDSLINYEPSENDFQWIYPKEENKTRIIWSPHHTLSRPNMDDKLSYSTFDENYEFFYEYAKNHPETEWVVRPHPLLKEVLSNINTYLKVDGIIDSSFVDDYFYKWNALPNATVHEELDYYDLFATADALITDCISFRSEYLFANKPGLILKKRYAKYEGYDGIITDAWYVENGSDFDKIEDFIENVVIGGNDYLKEKREAVFNEYLDYNTGNASKMIYEYIKNEIQ